MLWVNRQMILKLFTMILNNLTLGKRKLFL
ncbi:hypothetical protein CY0110_18697 [Crocosphaera chwakensis CCY0110]|uniref:Uncharacterized protein n=1 Tax=Crocosphaera chwakensis CCY0110 TaxID=391612 RepID=A3IJ71_9CHRO|nr:hypothetical protein CY0110_18697 [Crocosphaera chwakensis CCY0110]